MLFNPLHYNLPYPKTLIPARIPPTANFDEFRQFLLTLFSKNI